MSSTNLESLLVIASCVTHPPFVVSDLYRLQQHFFFLECMGGRPMGHPRATRGQLITRTGNQSVCQPTSSPRATHGLSVGGGCTLGNQFLHFEPSPASLFFSHFYFPASGQAVVKGVVPSPSRFLPSIFIAQRVQQSHCPSIFHRSLACNE